MIKKLLVLTILSAMFAAGCAGAGSLVKNNHEPPPLIKVEVHFTGAQEPITAYVRDLDLAANGRIYSGGSSTYNLYDASGELMAVANYQRIEYIKVVK